MEKILIYSDCFVFSGSENVIENILKSDEIKDKYQLHFYYAYNKTYKAGIERKFTDLTRITPIGILSAYGQWGYKAEIKAQQQRIPFSYARFRYLASLFFQKAGLHDLYNGWVLYRLFRKARPDLLYINNGGYPGARSCRIVVISARAARIQKVIFNVNNMAAPQKGPVDKWLDNLINRHTNIFITASRAAGRQLVAMRNFNADKCVNIPNTLSRASEEKAGTLNSRLRQEFNVGRDEIVLGAVGLLTYRKGFHVLLDAVHLLKQQNAAAFKLFVFGEGEQRALLEAKIKEYNLEDTVFLPGFRDGILGYVKDFDVFLCPSVANEDFPYVIIEAMLLAKPVIGTNIAGIPEQIVDEHNGYIVQAGNATELAAAIGRLAGNRALLQAMGKNGYDRYMNNYNNQNVMHLYNQLFGSLLAKKSD